MGRWWFHLYCAPALCSEVEVGEGDIFFDAVSDWSPVSPNCSAAPVHFAVILTSQGTGEEGADSMRIWGGETWSNARLGWYDPERPVCLTVLIRLMCQLMACLSSTYALWLRVWNAMMCYRLLCYANDFDSRRASGARGKSAAQKHRLGKPAAVVSFSRGVRWTRGALHLELLLRFVCISCCVPSGYAMLASNKGLMPGQTLISAIVHVAVPVALVTCTTHMHDGRTM